MLEDALAELLKVARKRTKTAASSNGDKKSPPPAPRAPSGQSRQASP
jgi:hypothetical protein